MRVMAEVFLPTLLLYERLHGIERLSFDEIKKCVRFPDFNRGNNTCTFGAIVRALYLSHINAKIIKLYPCKPIIQKTASNTHVIILELDIDSKKYNFMKLKCSQLSQFLTNNQYSDERLDHMLSRDLITLSKHYKCLENMQTYEVFI